MSAPMSQAEIKAIGEAEDLRYQKLMHFSDFHKSVFGYRPRGREHFTEAQCIAAYDAADYHLQREKRTRAGRDRLREAGWIIEEVRP